MGVFEITAFRLLQGNLKGALMKICIVLAQQQV